VAKLISIHGDNRTIGQVSHGSRMKKTVEAVVWNSRLGKIQTTAATDTEMSL
jgi:hypothetical protein